MEKHQFSQFTRRYSRPFIIDHCNQKFHGDNTANVDDPTLPVNPADPPNTLILIAGTEVIDRLEYKSTFQRGGVITDSSSLELIIEDVPNVVLIEGSFLVAPTGIDRVNYDNPNLNTIAQIFDNALLSVVEVVLDIGEIVNTLPDAIIGASGSDGGTVEIHCFDQVRANIGGDLRETLEIGLIELSFSSSDNPVIPDQDHILLAQDSAIDLVNGRFGATEPLVPVAISLPFRGFLMSIKTSTPILTEERLR